MQIKLTTESLDRLPHECLVLGFFSDERPPRGNGGFVDWRLNGLVSRLIADGKIRNVFIVTEQNDRESVASSRSGRLAVVDARLIHGPVEEHRDREAIDGSRGLHDALDGPGDLVTGRGVLLRVRRRVGRGGRDGSH